MANEGGIGALVNEKLNAAPAGKAADTRGKFMVYLEEDDNKKLTNISKVLASGKIELGSQLFSIGIQDAFNKLVAAGKLDAKTGDIVGAEKAEEKTPKTEKAAKEPVKA